MLDTRNHADGVNAKSALAKPKVRDGVVDYSAQRALDYIQVDTGDFISGFDAGYAIAKQEAKELVKYNNEKPK